MREALERVKRGEEIQLTQNGEVVAVWLHPSKLRQRVRTPHTLAAERLREQLEQDRRNPPQRGDGITAERAEEMIRDVRAEREHEAWDDVEGVPR